MTNTPSAIRRNALRAAVRAHRDAAEAQLNGRKINDLPLAELIAVAESIGLDAKVIMDNAAPAPNWPTPRTAPAEDSEDGEDDEAQDAVTRHIEAENAEAGAEDAGADAVEAQVAAVRGLIVSGGFGALDARLRELVTQANKPPVTITVEVPVPATACATGTGTGTGTAGMHVARCTGKEETWKKLCGVKGALGARVTKLWDGTHPDTPKVNVRYIWPQPQTAIALTQIARGRNAFLYGPPGTGKTEWAMQLAARTGRPFALISCDSATDAPTLVGMTVPSADGAVSWQDGQLTRAIQTPGCVVLIDEPSLARPGALFVMQNVLANRVLYVGETGRRVKVAEGVIFIAGDNTNGTGGGARRGFTDTNKLNLAFLDRFGVRVKFDYMPADQERDIIVSYTGCTPELATLLIAAAATTRAAAEGQQLTAGIGLRRLLSWAELLTDGVEAEDAFVSAVLNCAEEQDREALRQQCLLAYDKAQVAAALNGAPVACDPAATNPTPAGRDAAAQFRS
jgi:cobaltochelatase CobS